MKKITITLLTLVFFVISCSQPTRNQQQAKYENQTEKDTPVAANVRIREISESDFTTRQRESKHLQHQNNHKVIWDRAEIQKLLGDRVRGVGQFISDFRGDGTDVIYTDYYGGIEVTHSDGVTRVHNIAWRGWRGGACYYPELGILIVECVRRNLEIPIDLNDSERTFRNTGFPELYNLSPNKQWRTNGFFIGDATFNLVFLEKWNPAKERFEFAGCLRDNSEIISYSFGDAFWVSDNKLLFGNSWRGRYFEMEIIATD